MVVAATGALDGPVRSTANVFGLTEALDSAGATVSGAGEVVPVETVEVETVEVEAVEVEAVEVVSVDVELVVVVHGVVVLVDVVVWARVTPALASAATRRTGPGSPLAATCAVPGVGPGPA